MQRPPAVRTPTLRSVIVPARRAASSSVKVSRVLVRGEIANFRGVNARGHFYFALKDQRASVDVKLWATQAQRLGADN